MKISDKSFKEDAICLFFLFFPGNQCEQHDGEHSEHGEHAESLLRLHGFATLWPEPHLNLKDSDDMVHAGRPGLKESIAHSASCLFASGCISCPQRGNWLLSCSETLSCQLN